jgi:2-oxoglutarate ferredoxin oxidoreductase subunit alpha
MTIIVGGRLSDLTVMVAGQGGDGSLTVINHLSRVLGHRGFNMYTTRDVASRIKGGHAAGVMRASIKPRRNLGDEIDLLVAFDAEAVEKGGHRVSPDGVVIFDGSLGPPPAGYLHDSVEVLSIPFGRLAVRDLRRDLFKNSVAFGVACRVFGLHDDEIEANLKEGLSRFPDRIIDANVGALRVGLAYADEAGIINRTWELDAREKSPHLLITGNEALGFGFLAAGGRFYAGYPITPATDVLDFCNRWMGPFGGVSIQAEDELAAINMALGAAMTGVRSMTATSGPGIALMQEAIGQAGSAEIPVVIVNCQRSGPSTGMPTKPEQSDIGMMTMGGNGDFPRIVLVPSDPTDAFEIGVAATNLAQRLQGPVYVALDQAVAQNSVTVEPFPVDGVSIENGERLDTAQVAQLDEIRRYAVTDSGLSPWAPPGTPGGMSLVTGNEHNEWGLVSTDPENRRRQMAKRARKLDLMRPDLPTARRFGDPEAQVRILGVGMEYGPVTEAAERLADEGIALSGLVPRTMWPVPDETIEFINGGERTYVVEHSGNGQLAAILRSAGCEPARMESVLRSDGLPFTAAELVDIVRTGEAAR